MTDYIDPALAIPVALILWGIYILVRLMQSHREQADTTAELVRIQHTQAVIYANQVWGMNTAMWPSEIRDALGVES